MAVNLTETAIRALKVKKTSFYVWCNSSKRALDDLGAMVQVFWQQDFLFPLLRGKGKKKDSFNWVYGLR